MAIISSAFWNHMVGNSTEMMDRNYSKYSPLLNAEVHSGRKKKPWSDTSCSKLHGFMLCMVLGALVLGFQNRWQNFVWATSLFTHQFQAKPCRCSLRVEPIIERIDSSKLWRTETGANSSDSIDRSDWWLIVHWQDRVKVRERIRS